MLYLKSVQLTDIKCFSDITLDFEITSARPPWTIILGDNATGKTNLLRAIALGLCDESSAAGLMKESEEGYIRRGQDKGEIRLELVGGRSGKDKYAITTTITRVSTKRGSYETLRQTTSPKSGFPHDDIFACAYGAGRGTAGTGDIPGYTLINSVYNLFNYAEGLQNPELTIRRLYNDLTEGNLKDLLASVTHVQRLDVTKVGIMVDGAWGKGMPLRDLADGYKSTILWVTDLFGWAISFRTQFSTPSKIRGIVFIDELDQHLHPRWQESIVDELRGIFPNVQFIATTHSPLIASSVGGLEQKPCADKVYYLSLSKNSTVTYEELPSLRGMRVDQVLASRAFEYLITTDPAVNDILRSASHLAAKGSNRTAHDEVRYQTLKEEIVRTLVLKAQSPIERAIESEFLEYMRKRTQQLEATLFADESGL